MYWTTIKNVYKEFINKRTSSRYFGISPRGEVEVQVGIKVWRLCTEIIDGRLLNLYDLLSKYTYYILKILDIKKIRIQRSEINTDSSTNLNLILESRFFTVY